MKTIKCQSKEMTKVEQYLMTSAQDMVSMKDVPDGTSLPVQMWCEFTETKEETGEVVELLSIMSNDIVYALQSKTFSRNFIEIAELMEDTPFSIIKSSGETKAGRLFINCALDAKSVK